MILRGIFEVTYKYSLPPCHLHKASKAMTATSIVRDLTSFGMSYSVVGFASATEYKTSFGIYGGLVTFLDTLDSLMYFCGGKAREKL